MARLTSVLQYVGGPRDGEQEGGEGLLHKLDELAGNAEGDTIIRQMVWEPDHHKGPMYVCHKTIRI
jgi:hypothetical protein